jgi:hypothetical protein
LKAIAAATATDEPWPVAAGAAGLARAAAAGLARGAAIGLGEGGVLVGVLAVGVVLLLPGAAPLLLAAVLAWFS